MAKIVVIEDEPNIRELIVYNLKTNGYETCFAEDGISGITMVHREHPDLILLDIMLPGKDGNEICRELRAEGNTTPIIMITAKAEESDKVAGLEYGADDYITKPFGIREMIARVQAILRRYENTHKTQNIYNNIVYRDIKINVQAHEVKFKDKVIDLTLKEFELLKFLVENEERVFSREELLNKVWGIDYLGESRTVDVHIRHLRKKLSLVGDLDEGEYISTVRGKGYKIK